MIEMVIRETCETVEDAAWVRACVGGDEEALKSLYFRYNAIILNHLYKMMRDRIAAEDLTEETFFRVWRKASLFDERKGSFKTWLFCMATRLALNRLKKRARRNARAASLRLDGREVDDGSVSPEEAAGASETRDLLRTAMDTLGERDRAVLLLRHFEGLGEGEVARVLGIPKGTVKSRSYYAVKRLKNALEGLGFTRNNACL